MWTIYLLYKLYIVNILLSSSHTKCLNFVLTLVWSYTKVETLIVWRREYLINWVGQNKQFCNTYFWVKVSALFYWLGNKTPPLLERKKNVSLPTDFFLNADEWKAIQKDQFIQWLFLYCKIKLFDSEKQYKDLFVCGYLIQTLIAWFYQNSTPPLQFKKNLVLPPFYKNVLYYGTEWVVKIVFPPFTYIRPFKYLRQNLKQFNSSCPKRLIKVNRGSNIFE